MPPAFAKWSLPLMGLDFLKQHDKKTTMFCKGAEKHPPYESWDLKTRGLEIPEPCYTDPNPSIGGSNDS